MTPSIKARARLNLLRHEAPRMIEWPDNKVGCCPSPRYLSYVAYVCCEGFIPLAKQLRVMRENAFKGLMIEPHNHKDRPMI